MTRIALKDIAERAGVSVATVSLALRGKGEVAHHTIERVRRIAEEIGYRPNPVLSALASKRFSEARSIKGTGVALLEFPVLPGGRYVKESQYRPGLMEEAHRLGYTVSVVTPEDIPDVPALFHRLYHRAVQGLIISGSFDPATWGKDFDWDAFSIVQCARYGVAGPFHTVRPNVFQTVKTVFHTLLARGYRRIGFAIGRHETIIEDDEDRHGTAFALISEHLSRAERIPIYLGPHADRKAFVKWVQAHKPDVVVGFTSGHYWYLREAGYRIPDDVGFVALHQTESGPPAIAGMRQNTREIARQTVYLLDQLVRTQTRGLAGHPMDLLIPSLWENGDTIK